MSLDPRTSEEKSESVRLAEIDLKDQKYEDALKVLLPLARRDFAFTRETVNEIVINAQQWMENGEYLTALPILILCAEQNHAHAEYLLSAAYHFGMGVEKSEEKVREYCHEAASHGSPSANLVKAGICAGGKIYFSGLNWKHLPPQIKSTPAAPLPPQDNQTLSLDEQISAATDAECVNSSYPGTLPPSDYPDESSDFSPSDDMAWVDHLTAKSMDKSPTTENIQQRSGQLKEPTKLSDHTAKPALHDFLTSIELPDDQIRIDNPAATKSESNLLDDLLTSFTDFVGINKDSSTKPEAFAINEIAEEERAMPAVQIVRPKNSSSFGWLDVFPDKLWK